MKALGGLMRGSGNERPRHQGHAMSERERQGLRQVSVGEVFSAVTDVGRVRDLNEDRFDVSGDERLFIVADGLGGHASGEIASAAAVEAIRTVLSTERLRALEANLAAIEGTLREAFAAAHDQVRAVADSNPARHGMGTTLIVGWVAGDALYTCHAGDVRAYVKTAGEFRQLTEDHSFVAALVRAGALIPQQAQHHPARSELLQAVGIGRSIRPDFRKEALSGGDLVLLCSDGLWDEVEDEDIASIVSGQGSLRARALELVDRAIAAGGSDNITVILYEHGLSTADAGAPKRTAAAR
jgi:protein phosphatase